jgi:hypothetical protein
MLHRWPGLCSRELRVETHFGIEARLSLVAPIRLLGQQATVSIVVSAAVAAGNEKQHVPPLDLMENEYFGVGILFGDGLRIREDVFVRPVCVAERIVIEIVAVAVDDEYKRVPRRVGC